MNTKIEKSKKFVDEFKEFITKGNVMDAVKERLG